MNYLCEKIEPTRLYIKQCPHCGLKYFGKTVSKNIEKYHGSGIRWNNHLKKHCVKPIHLWNSDWYYDTSIARFALKFSRLNNIVASDKWANLIEENGLRGTTSADAKRLTTQQWNSSPERRVTQGQKIAETFKSEERRQQNVKAATLWWETAEESAKQQRIQSSKDYYANPENASDIAERHRKISETLKVISHFVKNNPKSKAVHTPLGTFPSKRQAAQAHDITLWKFDQLLCREPEHYFLV